MSTTAPGRLDAGEREEVVASFGARSDATRALDALTGADDVEIDELAIVGRDVELVEDVDGVWSFPRAAAQGASTGAFVGAVFGFVAGLFNWVEPLVSAVALAFYGLAVGAIAGALVGLLARAATGRTYDSVPRLRAQRYDLVAQPTAASAARAHLRERRSSGA